MATFVIDTYKVITELQQRGYSKTQAEGFVSVLQSADLADVATQDDVTAIKDAIAAVERSVQATRIEMYKVAAAQTLVIVGALVALAQVIW